MNTYDESNETSVELVLHSCLGAVFAVALAVMALWPHVRTLIE